MSRFKLELGVDHDRARVILKDRGEVVGMMNISWLAYEALLREIVMMTLKISRESIAVNLGARLWADAQRLSEESIELAKQKLAAMNWNQEQIDSYAEGLARNIAQVVAGMMPEVSR